MSTITGLSELNRYLETFEPRLRNNIVRGGLRKGTKDVLLPQAQANIHSVSGKLAAGLKIGTRVKGQTVKAYIKATGPHARVAHLVEHGTRAHFIPAKKGGALSFLGVFREGVHHPGAKPHPFARPALDQRGTAAVIAFGEYVKNRLQTKQGLDVGYVKIEGDE